MTDSIPNPFATVILAAGQGTRMKSERPKVLHEVGGLSLIGHVVRLCAEVGADEIVVVCGKDHEAVAEEVARWAPSAKVAVQDPPLGTGHAVQCALPQLEGFNGDLLVLFADTPMLRAENLETMRTALTNGAAVGVLGFRPDDPAQYGRLITGDVASDGNTALEAIAEFKDASPEQREIGYCNGGVMGLRGAYARQLLNELSDDNAQNEFYLTDTVVGARKRDFPCVAIEALEDDVMGVNSRFDLAHAEMIFQNRRRLEVMAGGVTLQDPSTVCFSYDTVLGQDVTVGQNVVFGVDVEVESGTTIKPFSHLEGAHVSRDASIGPYARLRPGADIGVGAKIGNFVEIKEADIEEGAKVSHLAYIGDARIGAYSNIGAGTITCNYDGYFKYFTDIGEDVFVGSNTALVAPVKIGDRANIAAGSTITKEVPANALGVARGKQSNKDEWAKKFRSKKSAEKAEKSNK